MYNSRSQVTQEWELFIKAPYAIKLDNILLDQVVKFDSFVLTFDGFIVLAIKAACKPLVSYDVQFWPVLIHIWKKNSSTIHGTFFN